MWWLRVFLLESQMLVSKLCAWIPYIPIPMWHLFHPSFPLGLSGLSQQHHWVFLLLNDRDFWSVVICGFICAVESAGWTSWVFFIYLDVAILKGKEQWFGYVLVALCFGTFWTFLTQRAVEVGAVVYRVLTRLSSWFRRGGSTVVKGTAALTALFRQDEFFWGKHSFGNQIL